MEYTTSKVDCHNCGQDLEIPELWYHACTKVRKERIPGTRSFRRIPLFGEAVRIRIPHNMGTAE